MWVQVPPLASSARRTRRFSAALVAIVAIVAPLAVGCAPFGDSVRIGAADRAIGRRDGPAAVLASDGKRTIAAWATAAEGGTAVDVAEVSSTPGTSRPTRLTEPSDRRRHPPIVFGGDGRWTVVWWETAMGAKGQIVWSESTATNRFTSPQALPAAFGTSPRGTGTPATFIALEGAPAGAGPARLRELGLWQRASESDSGWRRLGPPLRGRALGFAALGLSRERAAWALLGRDGSLDLGTSPAAAATRQTRTGARPSGPRPVWLSAGPGGLLAAWSEWSPGGSSSVRVSRSTTGGETWQSHSTLEKKPQGPHPLAAFGRDGTTVAATWLREVAGAPRVVLAVSTDGGASFSPNVLEMGAPAEAGRPSRPQLAVRGERVLVVWQVDFAGRGSQIRAALAIDRGARLAFADELVAEAEPGRVLRNPQAWLQGDGTGGVLWEALPAPETAAVPSGSAGPPAVTLHARPLRR